MYQRAVRGLDTTSSPEFQVLQYLYQENLYLIENDIVRYTGLSRGSVMTGVRRLQEKGLVDTRRQSGMATRSRVPGYKISEKGREEFEAVTGDWN